MSHFTINSVLGLDSVLGLCILPDMRENNLELMPHQEVGYEFAIQREHSYLAADMGLGKTGVALTLLIRKIGRAHV